MTRSREEVSKEKQCIVPGGKIDNQQRMKKLGLPIPPNLVITETTPDQTESKL